MKKTLYVLIAASCFLASCHKDNTTTTPSTVPDGSVVIINEGNFNHGEASVTLFDPAAKKTTADLFNKINGRPLGDVGQSMTIYNGKGYIVVNNSAKIEVVDANSFTSLGTINIPGSSPRYLLPVGGSKGYVSDLYSGKVYIVDLDAYTKTDSITVAGSNDQMVLVNNKVYLLNVVNFDSSYVKVIDPGTNAVTGSVFLPLHTGDNLVADGSGNLWALCGNIYDNTVTAGLVKINTTSLTVDQTLSYPLGTYGFTSLTTSPDGNTLFFVNSQGIYKMASSSSTLPLTTFVNAGGRNFYGLGVDKSNQKIYVGNGSFTQAGKVYSFNLSSGTAVDTIDAGVAPGHFTFK